MAQLTSKNNEGQSSEQVLKETACNIMSGSGAISVYVDEMVNGAKESLRHQPILEIREAVQRVV